MRALRHADPAASEALNRLGPDFQFSDVEPKNTQQVEDACQVVWGIKYLLYDLAVEGGRAIRTRLENVSAQSLEDEDYRRLTHGMSELIFQDAQRQWFPGLLKEVPRRRNPKLSWIEQADAVLARRLINPTDEQLAPNPLKELVEGKPPSVTKPKDEPKFGTNSKPDRGQTSPQPGRISNRHVDPSDRPQVVDDRTPNRLPGGLQRLENRDPDLLAPNPLAELGRGGQPVAPPTHPGTTSSAPPTTTQPSAASSAADRLQTYLVEREPLAAKVVPAAWYRNDQTMAIYYRLSGHADPYVRGWIDLAVESPQAESNPKLAALFQQATSLTSDGLCHTCHTIDRVDSDRLRVRWSPQYRDPSIRSFTRFSHRPHITQSGQENCTTCHELNQEFVAGDAFTSFNPHQFASSFKLISKDHCASCHRSGGADSSCTGCHNYHVGSRVKLGD